jgi:hypothetical protein
MNENLDNRLVLTLLAGKLPRPEVRGLLETSYKKNNKPRNISEFY